MTYHWTEEHEAACRRLYIDERKPLHVVANYIRDHHGMDVGHQSLGRQFRKWGFPKKASILHTDAVLVAKVKALWEQNRDVKEMLRILVEQEGYSDLTEKELAKVRRKHKLLLRAKVSDMPSEDSQESGDDDLGAMAVHTTSTDQHHSPRTTRRSAQNTTKQPNQSVPPQEPLLFPHTAKPPAINKGHSKPRRLTKRAGHIPRTVQAPPRFPSELTLDESKAILGLDAESYSGLRTLFIRLCDQAGIIKKTLAGPERWSALRDELIRNFPPLEAELWQSRDNIEQKKLALDIICQDCTKRVRVRNNHMSTKAGRVALGINPKEARKIRVVFHQIIEEHGVHSKTTAGPEKWNAMKNEWGHRSAIIQKALAGGVAGEPVHEEKLKALEMMARDVVRRRWGVKVYKAKRAKKVADGDGDGDGEKFTQGDEQEDGEGEVDGNPAVTGPQQQPYFAVVGSPLQGGDDAVSASNSRPPDASVGGSAAFAAGFNHGLVQGGGAAQSYGGGGSSLPGHAGMTFDPASSLSPSMLISRPTTNLGAFMPPAQQQCQSQQPRQQQQQQQSSLQGPSQPSDVHLQLSQQSGTSAPVSSSTPAFMRLHPSSTYTAFAKVWIATLGAASLREVRRAAVETLDGAACLRVEGVMKDGKGGEMTLVLDGDAELEAYLAHLNGGAPTFCVQIVPGWRG